jgi:uncharacterized protein (TIGR03067 family)
LGIYKFEGEKLWLCVPMPGDPRPDEFREKDGRIVVYVWERKEQAMAVGKQTKSDQDKIQGTWRVVNFCLPGVKQDEMLAAIWDHFKKQTTTFSGDEVHIDTGIPNQSVEPARFKLSPEHGPKQIDLIALRDANNPKDNLWGPGIYKFEDDKLWVCIAPPGGKRPSDFSTKDGADQSGLLVLERVPGKANYQGPAVPAQARKAIPLGRTWSGSHSGETKPEQIVVRTEKEWALVWKKSQDSRELLTPPKVDFDKEWSWRSSWAVSQAAAMPSPLPRLPATNSRCPSRCAPHCQPAMVPLSSRKRVRTAWSLCSVSTG